MTASGYPNGNEGKNNWKDYAPLLNVIRDSIKIASLETKDQKIGFKRRSVLVLKTIYTSLPIIYLWASIDFHSLNPKNWNENNNIKFKYQYILEQSPNPMKFYNDNHLEKYIKEEKGNYYLKLKDIPFREKRRIVNENKLERDIK